MKWSHFRIAMENKYDTMVKLLNQYPLQDEDEDDEDRGKIRSTDFTQARELLSLYFPENKLLGMIAESKLSKPDETRLKKLELKQLMESNLNQDKLFLTQLVSYKVISFTKNLKTYLDFMSRQKFTPLSAKKQCETVVKLIQDFSNKYFSLLDYFFSSQDLRVTRLENGQVNQSNKKNVVNLLVREYKASLVDIHNKMHEDAVSIASARTFDLSDPNHLQSYDYDYDDSELENAIRFGKMEADRKALSDDQINKFIRFLGEEFNLVPTLADHAKGSKEYFDTKPDREKIGKRNFHYVCEANATLKEKLEDLIWSLSRGGNIVDAKTIKETGNKPGQVPWDVNKSSQYKDTVNRNYIKTTILSILKEKDNKLGPSNHPLKPVPKKPVEEIEDDEDILNDNESVKQALRKLYNKVSIADINFKEIMGE